MSYLDKLLEGVEVEWKTVDDIFHVKNGYTPSKQNNEFWSNGTIPWFRMEDIRQNGRILSDSIQHVSTKAVKGNLIPANSLLMSTTATLGEYALVLVPYLTNQQITNFSLRESYFNRVNIKFLFYCFHDFGKWCADNANKNGGLGIIGISKLKQYSIPVPPLSVQKEIVRILDTFTELTAELTAELTSRKKQYNYYRDQLLSFEGEEIEWKSLGNIGEIRRGTAITEKETNIGNYPVVANGPSHNYYHDQSNRSGETIVIARSGAYAGLVSYWDIPIFLTDAFSIHPDNKFLSTKFLYYVLKKDQIKIHNMSKGAGVPHVRAKDFESYTVPVPPLEEQERIVSILDKFDTLTTSISEGLPKEIELRQKQYEYYRDMLLTFPKRTI